MKSTKLVKLLLGLLFAVVLGACAKARVTAPTLAAGGHPDTLTALEFIAPQSSVELIQYAEIHGLRIEELRIPYPTHVTVYQVHGRDLGSALEDFSREHIRFLTLMSTRTDTAIMPQRAEFNRLLVEAKTQGVRVPIIVAHVPPDKLQRLPGVRIRDDVPITGDDHASLPESQQREAEPQSLYHPDKPWAPYGGTSEVAKGYSYQRFIFNNLDKLGSYYATYEHETHLLDKNFANQTGYAASNMPYAYLDCGNSGDPVDNFAVGSMKANELRTYTWYWCYIGLTGSGQSASTSDVTIWAQRGTRYGWTCWRIVSNEHAGPLTRHRAPSGISWQY